MRFTTDATTVRRQQLRTRESAGRRAPQANFRTDGTQQKHLTVSQVTYRSSHYRYSCMHLAPFSSTNPPGTPLHHLQVDATEIGLRKRSTVIQNGSGYSCKSFIKTTGPDARGKNKSRENLASDVVGDRVLCGQFVRSPGVSAVSLPVTLVGTGTRRFVAPLSVTPVTPVTQSISKEY